MTLLIGKNILVIPIMKTLGTKSLNDYIFIYMYITIAYITECLCNSPYNTIKYHQFPLNTI